MIFTQDPQQQQQMQQQGQSQLQAQLQAMNPNMGGHDQGDMLDLFKM